MGSSLKFRILLFLGAAVVILATAVFVAYYSVSLVDVASKDYQSLSEDLNMLSKLQITVQRSLMPANDYLIHPDPKYQSRFDALATQAEDQLLRLETFHKTRASQEGARTREAHQAYMERDLATLAEVRGELGELKALALEVLSLPLGPAKSAQGASLMERMDEKGERITTVLQGLIDYHHEEMTSAWSAIEISNARAKRILLIKVIVASVLAIILIGLVITHANMLKQSIMRRNQLNSLYESGKHLTSLLDREQLMQWVSDTAAELMQSDAAGVHLLDGGRLIVGSRSEGAAERLYSEIPLDRASPWRKIINSNEPHLSANIQTDPIWPDSYRASATKAGFHSFLGVPLRFKDQAIGVLTVFRKNPGDFQAGEVEVFGAFADQAAVAFENIHLIESLKTTQYQLVQSEKMAGLGQFIAGMAHEVGTPLNIISGNAEYLLEVIEDKVDAREELQVIIQQTERITRLIQQLLDFSRPQREVVKKPLLINDLINQVTGLIGLQASKDGIEISTALQADIPPIIASAELLQQVFLNISLNAFHSMIGGGRLIVITQTGSRDPGMDAEPEWIEAIFRDTGEGISEENLNKVFDPFFSTKPSGMGTGLGLYVSYQIISNHGGEIQVESEMGKGTTVKVILPITENEDEGRL